ncbi:hypothetical protein BC831DRAFT_442036 [Entophlyctis helioformis]|nr:hypothetical protein BC831DRAFT_442036 [Entophlyctis helioformis]
MADNIQPDADGHDELDSYDYDYVHDVNQNLVCSICFRPFVDPVVTSGCDHTFCRACILRAVQASTAAQPHDQQQQQQAQQQQQQSDAVGRCPVDRRPLSLASIVPASKIVTNMVNELLVRCPHKRVSPAATPPRGSHAAANGHVDDDGAEGCIWIGQRQLLSHHLAGSCEWVLESCLLDGCPARPPRCRWSAHMASCPFQPVVCPQCEASMLARDAEDHRAQCPQQPTVCPHCRDPLVRGLLEAHIESCSLLVVPCTHSRFGCPWKGPRPSLASTHLPSCAYAAIQGFFAIFEQQQAGLVAENANLKHRIGSMEVRIESMTNEILRLRMAQPVAPQEPAGPSRGLIDQMTHDMQMMKNDLDAMNANIASLALQQDMSIMTENNRLRDEMQSIRAICQTIQIQLINLAFEHRKAGISGASGSSASAGKGSKNSPGASSPPSASSAVSASMSGAAKFVVDAAVSAVASAASASSSASSQSGAAGSSSQNQSASSSQSPYQSQWTAATSANSRRPGMWRHESNTKL